jgi:hypothetical protein
MLRSPAKAQQIKEDPMKKFLRSLPAHDKSALTFLILLIV